MTTTRTPTANRFQPIDPQPDDLPMPNQTDKTLAQIRTELLTTFSAADRESYSHLVGWLRDTDVASHALKVGGTAPDFLCQTPTAVSTPPSTCAATDPSSCVSSEAAALPASECRCCRLWWGGWGASSGWRPTRGRLRHSGVARRSVALCNPFPIVISRRPRRAIASESSRQRSRTRNRK
jgi:hypothetical protein